MTVFTSYDAVGIKEDISDIITNISPTKTPFQTMIGREKITQKFFQWQEDNLRPANLNAVPEGADASFIVVAPTVMRNNITQIFMEASQVSGTMEVTSTYGRARESAYQLAKSAAQVKRDLEVSLVGSNQALVTGSDGVARQMASYCQMIGFNQSSAGTYTTGVTLGGNSGTIPYIDYQNFIYSSTNGGATTIITEALLLQALEACYNAGGEPNTVMVTPTNSINVATWARSVAYNGAANGGLGGQQRYGLTDQKQLVNVVDVYVSPFGPQRVVINRFLNGVTATTGPNGTLNVSTADTDVTAHPWTLVFNPSMWVLATLRPWFREVLAKTGDSLKQMIVGEFSLKHKNYLADSIIVETIAPSNGSALNF